MTTLQQLVFSEYDGSNHEELANKHRITLRQVYTFIHSGSQAAIREALQVNGGNHLEILWSAPLAQSAYLPSSIAVLQAAQTALKTHRNGHAAIALVALPLKPLTVPVGSNLDKTSVASAENLQGTPSQKYALSVDPDSRSMSPFTLLLARLTAELGAEKAAAIVIEFGGLNIAFPAPSLYQMPVDSTSHNQAHCTGFVSPGESLDQQVSSANAVAATQLQIVADQLFLASQELLQHAKQIEQLHSIVCAKIGVLSPDLLQT